MSSQSGVHTDAQHAATGTWGHARSQAESRLSGLLEAWEDSLSRVKAGQAHRVEVYQPAKLFGPIREEWEAQPGFQRMALGLQAQ